MREQQYQYHSPDDKDGTDQHITTAKTPAAADEGVKLSRTLEEDENRNILKQETRQQQQIQRNREEERSKDDTSERLDAHKYKDDTSVSQDFALTKQGSQDRGRSCVLLDGREDDSLLFKSTGQAISCNLVNEGGALSSSSARELSSPKPRPFASLLNALELLSFRRSALTEGTSNDDCSANNTSQGEEVEEKVLSMRTLTTTSTSHVGASGGSTCDWGSNDINNNASDTMILERHSSSTLVEEDDESAGIDELQRELAVADAMHIISDIDSMIAAGGAAAFPKKPARRSLASAPIQKRPQLPLPQSPPPQQKQPLRSILKRFSNVGQPRSPPREEDDCTYDCDDGTVSTAELYRLMDVVAAEGGRNLLVIRSEDEDDNDDHKKREKDSDDDDEYEEDSDDDQDDNLSWCIPKDENKDKDKTTHDWQSTVGAVWCSVAEKTNPFTFGESTQLLPWMNRRTNELTNKTE